MKCMDVYLKKSDFNKKVGFPSPQTYQDRLGGWSKAIELAGFKPRPFPYKPIACDLYEGCFIKEKQLSIIRKAALYIANKLIEFAGR